MDRGTTIMLVIVVPLVTVLFSIMIMNLDSRLKTIEKEYKN